MSGETGATPSRTTAHGTTDPPSGPCFGRRPLLQTCVAGGVALVGAGALAACGAPPSTPTTPTAGRLAGLNDVPVGATTVVTSANGAPVALTRSGPTSVVAHSAVCTHQGCTVGPAGATLACPCHGSVFDPTTGAVQQGPANQPLPAIPVQIQGQDIVTTA